MKDKILTIENINGVILKKMSLKETRLHHWFETKMKSQGYTQSSLSELFSEPNMTTITWIKKGSPYSACEHIARVTGISEAELIIERACNLKECQDDEETTTIDISFSTVDGLVLKPMSIKETRFYHWYLDQKDIGETQTSIAVKFGKSLPILNKWVNKQYSYVDCEKIAEITGINEAELIVELVALKKYLSIDKL